MKRSTAALALLTRIAMAGLSTRPAAAVVVGKPFPFSTADFVVMVVTNDTQCSGALIAPTVVLTAAHCLTDPMAGNYTVLGGLNPLITSLFSSGVREVHPHPNHDPNTRAHDIGVLLLVDPAPATPLPWLSTDGGFYTNGTQVSVLGYGSTGPSALDSGIRRSGLTTISEVSAGQFLTNDMTGAGMCVGDAGGPAITTDEINSGTIIGVSSLADPECAEFSAFERTDTNAAFIASYAPEAGMLASAEAALGALLLLALRRG